MLEVLSLDPVRFGCKLSPQKDRKAVNARSFLHQIIISSRVELLYLSKREKLLRTAYLFVVSVDTEDKT